MFRNHLKIGYRNLWKHKTGTIINLAGLSIGVSAFILIALFIKDDLSYDRQHEHADETFRVTVKNLTEDGSLSRHWALASPGHASRLEADYSSITHAVRFYPWAVPDVQYGDLKLKGQEIVFVDENVFDIFSFPFIIGDVKNAFEDISSLVLTRQTAIRIFGEDWRDKDILGKVVNLSEDRVEGSFKITGVLEDMPEQQHFHFEYLAPMGFFESIMGEEDMSNVYGDYNWLTYVRITPGTNVSDLEVESREFFNKYIGKKSGIDASNFYAFEYQPLLDIHLHSNLEGEIEANGSIQQVYIFGIVGLLLLLVACVNYMNLATSNYSRRTKEVGIRKVVGAQRATLLSQFLIEALIVAGLAVPFTVLLVLLGLPYVNSFMGKNLPFDLLGNAELLASLFALILIVGFISGLYPALFLSRINMIKSLKGESAVRRNSWNFRNWLVTFQYAVAIALIFSILVIESQLNFLQNSDPGYQRDQILSLQLNGKVSNRETLKQELLSLPNVEKVSMSSGVPTGRLYNSWSTSFYKGDSLVPANFRLPFVTIDEDFLNTYEIALIAGQNFAKERDVFADSEGSYIVNRTAAEAMGYQNPQEIVGATLSYGPFNGTRFKMGNIIGVVEDFHYESMHSPIVPMVMLKTGGYVNQMSIKLNPQNMSGTLRQIEEVYAEFDDENPAEYRFIEERFDEQYQSEEKLSTLIRFFTLIAIFIGCLGLIGMVGFIIETRTKEIGIRKVLGASVQNILIIISSHFFILIGLAFLVALPISFWFMSNWLADFEYHTNISWWLIALPLILTMLFTIITLSYQSMRASYINPVESLKDE